MLSKAAEFQVAVHMSKLDLDKGRNLAPLADEAEDRHLQLEALIRADLGIDSQRTDNFGL